MRIRGVFLLLAASAVGQNVPQPVLDRLARSSIRGLGNDRVTAAVTDSAGYLYLAGMTTSPDVTPLAEGQLVTSTDAAATLVRLPEPAAVSLTSVGAARNVILVGGSSGIHKTVDAGKTWRLTYRFPPEVTSIQRIAFDPAAPSRVYAPWLGSTRSGLLVSTDAGDTWRAISDGPSGSTLRFDPNRAGTFLIFGDGAFLSTDGGLSFTRIVFDGSPPSSVTFDAHHPGWLTAIASGVLYRSMDFGRAWTRLGPAPPGAFDILSEPSRPGRYYLTIGSGGPLGGTLRSDDDGRTWTALPGSPEGRRLDRYCGPEGLLVIMGTNTAAYVSQDQGGTWRSLPSSNVKDLTFTPDCVAFAVRAISGDAWVAKYSPDARERLWLAAFGGSGQETVEKLTLDRAGNVIVAGRTYSLDFPGPTFGVSPHLSFVARFDPTGKLLWSSRFGAQDLLSAAALTADAAGAPRLYLTIGFHLANAAVVTGTSIIQFDPQGSLVEASLFPGNVTSAAVSASGETVLAIYAFAGSYLLRSDGTQIPLDVAPTHAVFHPSGDLVVAGYGSIGQGCTSRGSAFPILSGGSFEIRTFRAESFEPGVSVSLRGECQTLPTSLAFDPAGNFVVTARTIASRFPLRNPLFGGPSHLTSLVVKLSPKGELLQSTYVPSLGGAAANEMGLALALNEGGIVLGLLEPEPPPPVELNRISNAFSGLGDSIVTGSLLTLSGRNLGPIDHIDLGLNPSNPLPTELGGTRVLVNGQPAPVMAVQSDRIVFVAPRNLESWALLEVESSSGRSNPVWMPTRRNTPWPGLLTRFFPTLPEHPRAIPLDGNVRNQDGTVNSPDNSARAGDTVTVFVTGLTLPEDSAPPGAVASAPLESPDSRTNAFPPTARQIPGILSSVFEIKLTHVQPEGNTGRRPFYLFNNAFYRPGSEDQSNHIWIYVRTP